MNDRNRLVMQDELLAEIDKLLRDSGMWVGGRFDSIARLVKISKGWNWVLWDVWCAVADVFAHGTCKYGDTPTEWMQKVTNPQKQLDAAMRHILASKERVREEESGLPHLAHAIVRLLVALNVVLIQEEKNNE